MTHVPSHAAFTLTGVLTTAAVLAGIAAFCVPVVARRLERRVSDARSGAAQVESSVGGGLADFRSALESYGRTLLAPFPAAPAPVPPPLPVPPSIPVAPYPLVYPEPFVPLVFPPPPRWPVARWPNRRFPPPAWRLR